MKYLFSGFLEILGFRVWRCQQHFVLQLRETRDRSLGEVLLGTQNDLISLPASVARRSFQAIDTA
jgi:hypothetical protein